MSCRQVLVVPPDERWLGVLAAALRLGGSRRFPRRSIVPPLRERATDQSAGAVVLDRRPGPTTQEVETVRESEPHDDAASRKAGDPTATA